MPSSPVREFLPTSSRVSKSTNIVDDIEGGCVCINIPWLYFSFVYSANCVKISLLNLWPFDKVGTCVAGMYPPTRMGLWANDASACLVVAEM